MTVFQLRLPENVDKRLREIKKARPHLSLNAIIIEALMNDLAMNEVKTTNTQLNLPSSPEERAELMERMS